MSNSFTPGACKSRPSRPHSIKVGINLLTYGEKKAYRI